MVKRLAWTFTELAVFAALVALAAGGCGGTAKLPPSTATGDAPSKPVGSEPLVTRSVTKSLGGVSQSDGATVTKLEASNVEDTPLIPREVLFGNPERAQARLSPDGKWLSFLAPVDSVLNVWVGPSNRPSDAAPVTDDKVRGIRSHGWAYNNQYIVYAQDKGGDENWRLYATDVETKETRDLTPIEGVHAIQVGGSEKFPDEILVGLNDREPRLHDIYRVNLRSGQRFLVQQNPGVAGFVMDNDLKVRMAYNFTATGGQEWLKPQGEPGVEGYEDWSPVEEWGPEDAMTSGAVGFDKSGRLFYYEDSRGRDTAGLFSHNLDTDAIELIAEDPRADVGGVMTHPETHRVQAVSFTYSRSEWQVLDESVRADIEFLTAFPEETGADGEWQVTSRTLDDSQWIVVYEFDDGPTKYYRYSRPLPGESSKRRMSFLFNERDDLDDYQLVKLHAPVLKSRDGLNLVSYLSLPPGSDPDGDGVPAEPVPMVLAVHGGPWARDDWGFDPYHQWLANRGYAVLSVNYRGSTGFGKEFINAANGEWAGKMHDDLLDAVKWAVDGGIAQQDKVAIFGGSYGGYATLVGMTFTPDKFACGVDVVGPSSLVTLLENVPDYWLPFMPVMKVRLGDVSTEEGREDLLARSPLTFVDKIERPLLIGQGANDPRVTQVEADQIVRAMTEKGIPVTYVLYPDEGHGFARPENDKSFNAITEAFLSEHLGGRCEPIGSDFTDSSLYVPAGVEGTPGLDEALPDDRKRMPPPEPPDASQSDQ